MRILFLGQRGIPVFGRAEATAAERRVEALATVLVRGGHTVAVTCATPFIPRTVRALGGAALLHRASFNPQQPGGWLYTVLEILSIRRAAPQAVHLHGWRQALLSPLARFMAGEAAMVLTADEAPRSWLERRAQGMALRAVDTITVPSRAVQSQLLQEFGVVAEYVPDGYAGPEFPLLPVSTFGVRKNQTYFIMAAPSPAALRWLGDAGKRAGLKQKVLVLAEAGPRSASRRRLAHRSPFLRFVGQLKGRKLASLLDGASGLLMLDTPPDRSLLLQAMHAGLPVIATTDPLIQETAGADARYVRRGNAADLAEELRGTFGSPHKRRYYGSRGRKRARAHFTWERIAEEYISLYVSPAARPVLLDSAYGLQAVSTH